MPAPTLTTARLVLRQLREDDAAALFPVLSDAEVMTWWSSGPHQSVAETEAYLEINAAEGEGYQCWSITVQDDDSAVGWVILSDGKPGVAEIGYILRRDRWGAGIAKEAVAGVIEHGFCDMDLRRIVADSDPENDGSIALLGRLGFTREGRLRGEWLTHIGIRDAVIFGLLADEWPGAALTETMEKTT